MFPWPGIESGPWRWKRQILTTRPPGRCCYCIFLFPGSVTLSQWPVAHEKHDHKQTFLRLAECFWSGQPAAHRTYVAITCSRPFMHVMTSLAFQQPMATWNCCSTLVVKLDLRCSSSHTMKSCPLFFHPLVRSKIRLLSPVPWSCVSSCTPGLICTRLRLILHLWAITSLFAFISTKIPLDNTMCLLACIHVSALPGVSDGEEIFM